MMETFEYNSDEYIASRRAYLDDIRTILVSWLPTPQVDWDVILVLSWPEITFEESNKDGSINQTESRFKTSLDLAKKVASLKLGKELKDISLSELADSASKIYFTGNRLQNHYVQALIREKEIETRYNFPSEKIIISNNREVLHTADQIIAFANEYNLPLWKVVVVSDLFHLPRVKKYIEKYMTASGWSSVVYPAEPVTLPMKDTLQEARKIYPYTKQGML
jgi:uncharacterized SAM-binding protein YcdF (DUF218 family)